MYRDSLTQAVTYSQNVEKLKLRESALAPDAGDIRLVEEVAFGHDLPAQDAALVDVESKVLWSSLATVNDVGARQWTYHSLPRAQHVRYSLQLNVAEVLSTSPALLVDPPYHLLQQYQTRTPFLHTLD